MSTKLEYPHLTCDANGKARIGNTRYKVVHLAAEHLHHGWTAEELLRQHPDLRPEEVYAALAYFYDHREALLAEMKSAFSHSVETRPAQGFSREELLSRKPLKQD